MIKRFGVGLCALIASMVPNLSAAPCSNTSSCTFQFTTSNSGSGLTGTNFGTVNLSLVSNTIVFNINLTNGLRIWDYQNAQWSGAFGFNDNLSGALTITGYNPNTYSGDATNQSFPDLGTFNYMAPVDGPGQQNNGANLSPTLSFTVSRSGGFSDVNQLVALNGNGNYFAAHVLCTGGACGSAGTTGGIAATTVVANPEPASYFGVLSAGFGLMLFLVHKRRNRRSVVS